MILIKSIISIFILFGKDTHFIIMIQYQARFLPQFLGFLKTYNQYYVK